MREYVLAGEVAAILDMDTKTSPWAVWNRMTDDEQAPDIGDRGLWQGRLAGEIAHGIAKDHSLSIVGTLASSAGKGIMPPRGWQIEACMRTGGKPGVLIVQQKTQPQMFGWKAPHVVPVKAAIRLKAAAIAYGYERVLCGLLIDGYRGELYQLDVEPELAAEIEAAVADMIEKVREDDEPVIDYAIDRSAIRSGKATTRADASEANIRALIDERAEVLDALTKAKGEVKGKEARRDEIDTMLIHLISKAGNFDLGDSIVSIETRGKGQVVKVTKKGSLAEALF